VSMNPGHAEDDPLCGHRHSGRFHRFLCILCTTPRPRICVTAGEYERVGSGIAFSFFVNRAFNFKVFDRVSGRFCRLRPLPAPASQRRMCSYTFSPCSMCTMDSPRRLVDLLHPAQTDADRRCEEHGDWLIVTASTYITPRRLD